MLKHTKIYYITNKGGIELKDLRKHLSNWPELFLTLLLCSQPFFFSGDSAFEQVLLDSVYIRHTLSSASWISQTLFFLFLSFLSILTSLYNNSVQTVPPSDMPDSTSHLFFYLSQPLPSLKTNWYRSKLSYNLTRPKRLFVEAKAVL